jgi:glycosyltransferase involved in cell wall biosynthesis
VFDDVDAVVAPSASMAAEYEALGVDSAKLRTSDYGFRARATRPPRATHGGPLQLGFVGTPVWHKGLHVLIEALRLLPADSCSLTVYGDTSIFPDYIARLRERTHGLPAAFAGSFPREEADAVYHAFDVLVVPSIWLENSPLVVHEAFMAGVPVVASRIGGLPGLVHHEQNGLLFEVGNPMELAAALRRLLEEPALLQRLRSAQTAVKSIEQDADEWDAVYAALLRRTEAAR